MVPLEYGGAKDGKQVNLCATCHNIVHREGEHYFKHGEFDQIETVANTPRHAARLKKLAGHISTARINFEDGNSQFKDQRLTSVVHWNSEAERQIAHIVKTAIGATSLDKAIRAIVLEKYERLKRKGRV